MTTPSLAGSAASGQEPDGGVRAAERALRVLGVFSDERKLEWSLEEIAARAELPKSTTHRLLATIMAKGFVEPGEEFGSYRLALHTAVVGRVALRRARPSGVFESLLTQLAQELGVTAGLSVRHETSCVGIDRVMARRTLNWDLGTGVSGPCHCTAGGKVLLARLSDAEIVALYGGASRLAPVTPRSITTMEGLLREVATVRETGFAVDDREFRRHAACVGVSVERGESGDAFALVVAVPCPDRSVEELISMLPQLKSCAGEMARRAAVSAELDD